MSSGFNKANLVSVSKATTENDKIRALGSMQEHLRMKLGLKRSWEKNFGEIMGTLTLESQTI